MFLLDANILIYAFRHDSPHHQSCYQWLTQTLGQGAIVSSTSLVELALVRIMTLPALGKRVADIGTVISFLHALRKYPNYTRLEPGQRHDACFERLCSELHLCGNDLNDAYLAALALEYDVTLVSADEGFSRFSGLKQFNPILL